MKRRKHKKDQRNPKDRSRIDEYKGKFFQGWMRPSSRNLRKIIKTNDDIVSGGFFRKIGSWFEYN
jgi:hypothetical protein